MSPKSNGDTEVDFVRNAVSREPEPEVSREPETRHTNDRPHIIYRPDSSPHARSARRGLARRRNLKPRKTRGLIDGRAGDGSDGRAGDGPASCIALDVDCVGD